MVDLVKLTFCIILFCNNFFLLLGFVCVIFALFIEVVHPELSNSVWAWIPLLAIGAILVSLLVLISRQPSIHRVDSFAVPFTPWLPGISIIINIYLMMQLDYMTWVRFTVWIAIGLIVYFLYGIRNSVERKRHAQIAFMNNKQNQSNLFTCSREILVP